MTQFVLPRGEWAIVAIEEPFELFELIRRPSCPGYRNDELRLRVLARLTEYSQREWGRSMLDLEPATILSQEEQALDVVLDIEPGLLLAEGLPEARQATTRATSVTKTEATTEDRHGGTARSRGGRPQPRTPS